MSNQTIEILNDVTETMIDSYKGYEKCIEISDDSYALRQNFQARAQQRSQLINEFQNQIRQYGGEPKTDGTVGGKLHRTFTQVSSVFRDDEQAALSAIDDGEDYLAEKVESCLEDNTLPTEAQTLLKRAHASAKSGERFADMLQG